MGNIDTGKLSTCTGIPVFEIPVYQYEKYLCPYTKVSSIGAKPNTAEAIQEQFKNQLVPLIPKLLLPRIVFSRIVVF